MGNTPRFAGLEVADYEDRLEAEEKQFEMDLATIPVIKFFELLDTTLQNFNIFLEAKTKEAKSSQINILIDPNHISPAELREYLKVMREFE